MRWLTLMMLLAMTGGCKRDDMADQARIKVMTGNSIHAAPEGTVPFGADAEDDPSWQHPTTLTRFPFEITAADLTRGQQQFAIQCAPCHGLLGDGDGMVPERGFLRPSTFHSDRLRNAPPSYFYDVMTKGIGAMFPAAQRVAPDDRWRIAAYIRALQLAAHAPAEQAAGGSP